MRALMAGSPLGADLAGVAVVRRRLAVRVEPRGRVSGLLQEADRAIADRLELVAAQPALAAERGRAAVVLGQQRNHLLGPVSGAIFDEGADLVVLSRTDGLGQHAVGHVADQDVLEGQLALAGQPALRPGREDVLLLQREQGAFEIAALRVGERGQRALPERAPHHRGLLHEPALERLQGVQARGEDALHGVGQLAGVHAAALGDPAGHLLGEQRVAARALDDGGQHGIALGEQRGDERLGVRGAQRLEYQLRGRRPAAAPLGPALEQLVPGQADEHEGPANPLRQVLDGVEHAVVGPVDVLEGEDQRLLARPGLDPGAQRGEEPVAQPLGVLSLGDELGRDLESDQAAQQRRPAHALLVELMDGAVLVAEKRSGVLEQLFPRLVGRVAVDDAAAGPDHLTQGPEDDAAAVWQAAPGVEGRGVRAGAQAAFELAQHARLPDAGLAHERDKLRSLLALHALEQLVERGQLGGPADERGLARGRHPPHRVLGDEPDRLPGGDRLGLALERQGGQPVVADRAARGAHGPFAYGHAARPGRALKAGGHVHGVADDGVGLADRAGQHLAGVDPHAKVAVDLGRQTLVDLVHGGLHAEPRANRSLGVVLVRHGRAEDGHHVVADVLVHGAAVAPHLATEPHQRAIDQRLDRFGVHALGHRRIARQVGEQDRDLTAFLGGTFRSPVDRRRGLQRRAAAHAEVRLGGCGRAARRAAPLQMGAAGHAEARPRRILGAAGGAVHHPSVLGGWPRRM